MSSKVAAAQLELFGAPVLEEGDRRSCWPNGCSEHGRCLSHAALEQERQGREPLEINDSNQGRPMTPTQRKKTQPVESRMQLVPRDLRTTAGGGRLRKRGGNNCSVRSCPRELHGKGYCATHYRRIERGEDLKAKVVGADTQVPILTRVPLARKKLLVAVAKQLGFRSLYSLASVILEQWVPPRRIGMGATAKTEQKNSPKSKRPSAKSRAARRKPAAPEQEAPLGGSEGVDAT